MNGLALDALHERAMLARTLARLMRAGWSAGDAVRHVAELAGAGGARDLLQRYAAALAGGDEATLADADPLLALLVRGERAGAEALAEGARGFELEAQAQSAAAAALRHTLVALAGCLVLLCVLAFGVAPAFADLFAASGAHLPLATAAALEALAVLRWLVPGLFVGMLWFWWRRPDLARLPGVRALRRAARLRLFAAALDSGIDEGAARRLAVAGDERDRDAPALAAFGLDAVERAVAERLLAVAGASAAARAIADDAAARGAQLWRLAVMHGPLLVVAVTLVFGVALAAPLVLPLFALAGGP